MITITGGTFKGRKINRPNSKITRPTTNKIRQAIFNSLFNIKNYVCLDLFSGSASYGIEALSRQAETVYFNDSNKEAFNIIKDNIKKLDLINNSHISNLDCFSFINKAKNLNITFDLIFLDPPFNFKEYDLLLEETNKILKKEGKIVLEINKNTGLNISSNYIKVKDKLYGNKRVIILKIN